MLISSASSTIPSVPITLIDKMLASGQTWRISPAMKVPWPKNGSIRPSSGSIRLGSGSPPVRTVAGSTLRVSSL